MEHQFNLGSAIQPPPFIPKNDPEAPMLASVEGVAARLSEEEVIFQPRGRSESQVMTMQVLELMGQSRSFRTIDHHIAQALRTVPGLHSADRARQAIETLHRAGLMQSDAEWSAARLAAPAATPSPFAGLCIRACDRPDQVQALLTSLAEYESRFGARRPVWLLDDSRDKTSASRNRALLEAHAKASAAPVHYIDADAGARVADLLGKVLPPHAEVADGLLRQHTGSSGGRNWNLLLLLTAGQRLVMLDEDFLFPLRRHPEARDGLDPQASDQSTARFYASLEAVLAAGEDLDADPIEQHLAVLGQSLATVLRTPGLHLDRQDLRNLELAQLAHLGVPVRIASTMVGTRGASGSSSNAWLYELDPTAREDFWRDRESYLHNIEAQSLWFGHTRARCAPRSYFTPFGLDNGTLTPCTTPSGRNEDALFGTLLRFCQPDSVALHLPQAIGHAQEGQRKRSNQSPVAGAPTYNNFLYDQLQNCDPGVRASDPATRMRFAAATLENIAGASDAALAAHLREYLDYSRAGLIERLQKQLVGSPKAPVYWQTDVRSLIESTARAMVAKAPPRLENWSEGLDEAGCANELRTQLLETARTLRAWPELWSFAHDHAADLRKAL